MHRPRRWRAIKRPMPGREDLRGRPREIPWLLRHVNGDPPQKRAELHDSEGWHGDVGRPEERVRSGCAPDRREGRRRVVGEEVADDGVAVVGLFDEQPVRCSGDDCEFGVGQRPVEGDAVF